MAYKIIQWATGGVGIAQLQEIIQHPDFELVGVFVYNPDKNGVDAGTLCGLPPTGILATNDKEAIFTMDADVVCHAATKYGAVNTNADDIERLLRSGKNVVTTTTYNHLPTYGDNILERFESACAAGNSSFRAAGENPGFMMQRLAATLTGLSKKVDHIILEEYFLCDWHQSRQMVFDGMLMGAKPENVTVDAPVFQKNTLQYAQEIGATAEILGVTVEKIVPSIEVATLDYDLSVAAGVIPAGTAAAQKLSWTGYVNGKPFLTIREFWCMTKDVPQWELEKLVNWKNLDYFQIIIEGIPNLTMGLDISLESEEPYLQDISAAHMIIAMSGVRILGEVYHAPVGVIPPRVFGAYKAH